LLLLRKRNSSKASYRDSTGTSESYIKKPQAGTHRQEPFVMTHLP